MARIILATMISIFNDSMTEKPNKYYNYYNHVIKIAL